MEGDFSETDPFCETRSNVEIPEESLKEVRFGTVQLDGVMGLFGQHWALKIGNIWHEVGPVDGTEHIEGQLASVNSSVNIISQYKIKTNEGDTAASKAAPTPPAVLSHMSALWPLALVAISGAVMSRAFGANPGLVLRLGLGPVLAGLLYVGLRLIVRSVVRCLGLEERRICQCGHVAGFLGAVLAAVLAGWLIPTRVFPALAVDAVTVGATVVIYPMIGILFLQRVWLPRVLSEWRGETW